MKPKTRESHRYHHQYWFRRDREHPVMYRPLPRPNRRDYGWTGEEITAIIAAGAILSLLAFGAFDSLIAWVTR